MVAEMSRFVKSLSRPKPPNQVTVVASGILLWGSGGVASVVVTVAVTNIVLKLISQDKLFASIHALRLKNQTSMCGKTAIQWPLAAKKAAARACRLVPLVQQSSPFIPSYGPCCKSCPKPQTDLKFARWCLNGDISSFLRTCGSPSGGKIRLMRKLSSEVVERPKRPRDRLRPSSNGTVCRQRWTESQIHF